jgi:hypothetical protein
MGLNESNTHSLTIAWGIVLGKNALAPLKPAAGVANIPSGR